MTTMWNNELIVGSDEKMKTTVDGCFGLGDVLVWLKQRRENVMTTMWNNELIVRSDEKMKTTMDGCFVVLVRLKQTPENVNVK